MELHFEELPSKELETILHKRCNLPMSYSKTLVNIMLELQVCSDVAGEIIFVVSKIVGF